MPRFFLPPTAIQGDHFTLSGSEAHHALHVLRKRIGDDIELFDGKDLSYRGRIDNIQDDRIQGTLVERRKTTALPVEITLCQALTRGPKWEWLLEKAGEIGITRVVPIVTQRGLIPLAKAKSESKLERWNRIALAASKQSGRADIMKVEDPVDVHVAFSQLPKSALSLIPWEKEGGRLIREPCAAYRGNEVRIFIGPEGGWEGSEIAQAQNAGAIPVRLGPTLLRTETAGLVAATLVWREFGVY